MAATGAFLGAFSAGCSKIEQGGIDAAYLRSPSQKPPPITAAVPSLFPPEAGRRWTMRVQDGDKIVVEEIVNKGAEKIGAETGYLRETYRGGKLYRHEVYRVSPKELGLMAVGTAEEMTLEPPMPLLRIPAESGDGYPWEGQIISDRGVVPATAYSRVTGPETVKMGKGAGAFEFETYRIDTNLTAVVDGRQIHFPATRWLAPGVGVVKEQYLVGKKVVVKELSRRPPK